MAESLSILSQDLDPSSRVASHGTILTRFLSALARPRASALIVLLATVLPLPALFVGWESDDFVHKLVLQYPDKAGALGLPNTPTPGGMFHNLDGGQGMVQRAVDQGLLPWWTHPEVKASFLRPLTFATHWLDYRLWPESPLLMHAHSLGWYVLLVVAVVRFFRRCSGGMAWGTLAALLYAIDDTHATPIGWIANRNAVLATFFGVLSLHAYIGGCTSGPSEGGRSTDRSTSVWRPASWTALWLLMALLCGEVGAATWAYLLAGVLLLDRRPWSRRMAALLPAVLVSGIWLIAWKTGGYGTHAVGMYTDPFAQPFTFLQEVAMRLPVLLLAALALPPADTFLVLPPAGNLAYSAVAAILIVGFAAWTGQRLWQDRMSRFFIVGALVSALPPCAVTPSDRSLMFVGLGVMGLVTRIIHLVAAGEWDVRHGAGIRRLAAFLLFFHLVAAGIALPFRAYIPLGPRWLTQQFDVPLDLVPHDAGVTVVVVNNASAFNVGHLPMRVALKGGSPPRMRVLAPSLSGVRLERLDEHTLQVSPYGPFLYPPIDRVFRGEDVPLRTGETVSLKGMTVLVDEVTGYAAASYRVRFDVPLEDSSLVWIRWENGTFARTQPPVAGQPVTLPLAVPQ